MATQNDSGYTSQLVEYAYQYAKWTLQSGSNLQVYLNSLARFSEYSLNNQLLIMAYKPDAVMIRGWYEWQEMGISVNENAIPIQIIEPVTLENGGRGFQAKYMADIRDTNAIYNPVIPDKSDSLEALLTDRKYNIVVVDEIKKGVRAMYMPNDKSIHVKRSSQAPADEFFTAIAAEMVHASFGEASEGVYKRASNQLTAMCTAYALGIKYGIDVSNISFENLPDKYTQMSEKVAMKELDKVRDNFLSVDKNVSKALEQIKGREMTEYAR
ncbi:MAG: hypothetical protein IJO70_00590 [Lachnospiraceae bacterium]|nr:hypothetical protein [Lachnospiraceae bacterium]